MQLSCIVSNILFFELASAIQQDLSSAAVIFPLLARASGVSSELLDRITHTVAQKSALLTLNDVGYDEAERNFWNDERCSQLRRYLSSLYTSRNACNKVFETVFNQGGLVEV